MKPIVIVICLLIIAFVSFFIAYSEEKKSVKKSKGKASDFVDDCKILFEDEKGTSEESNSDDIEII